MATDGGRELPETSVLVGRALTGDRDAFAELVRRYRDAASAVAFSFFGSFDDVEDAVQEAFLQAFVRLSQLRDPEKFGPWLRTITSNVCADFLRQRERRNLSIDDAEQQLDSRAGPDSYGDATRAAVRDALAKLPEKARLTVTLSYIDGYSHAEIADFLDVAVSTVRSRLQCAKRQLREELIHMVSDVLHNEKPDDQLVIRIAFAARGAVISAQQEAARLGHNVVDTEHLLLGILRNEGCVGARVLRDMSFETADLIRQVEHAAPSGPGYVEGESRLSASSKRVIDIAYEEARACRNPHLNTGHVLLGLLREENGLAGRILIQAGVDPSIAREAVSNAGDERIE